MFAMFVMLVMLVMPGIFVMPVMLVMFVACSAGQLIVFELSDWAVLATEY